MGWRGLLRSPVDSGHEADRTRVINKLNCIGASRASFVALTTPNLLRCPKSVESYRQLENCYSSRSTNGVCVTMGDNCGGNVQKTTVLVTGGKTNGRCTTSDDTSTLKGTIVAGKRCISTIMTTIIPPTLKGKYSDSERNSTLQKVLK